MIPLNPNHHETTDLQPDFNLHFIPDFHFKLSGAIGV